MGRPRTYATAADRQKAYRIRLAARETEQPPPVVKLGRPPSRPARLAALEAAARVLRDEYQGWLDSLPESLEESCQAERLRETVEQLDAVTDLLVEVQPPRGFGKD